MKRRIWYHPLADFDLDDVAAWYDGERPGLGEEFVAAVHGLAARIAENALQFPVVRARPARSPFDALQAPTRGPLGEAVVALRKLSAELVQRLGDVLSGVAGDVFPQRMTVELAAGLPEPPSEALGVSEDVVGNGHGGFHTESMTRSSRSSNAAPPPLELPTGCNSRILRNLRRRRRRS